MPLLVSGPNFASPAFYREKHLHKMAVEYYIPAKRIEPESFYVSVVIPCAASHFCHLFSLLGSYQNQTRLPDEVVISLSQIELLNCCEIDALEEMSWPFVCKILRHNGKRSAGVNRLLACKSASGDLIVCQDADDIPHPQRIEIVSYVFENYPICHLLHMYTLKKDVSLTYEGEFCSYSKEEIPLYSFPRYDDLYRTPIFDCSLHNGNICFLRPLIESVQWDDVFECDHDVKFNRDVYRLFQNHGAIPCDLMIYRPQFSAFNQANK